MQVAISCQYQVQVIVRVFIAGSSCAGKAALVSALADALPWDRALAKLTFLTFLQLFFSDDATVSRRTLWHPLESL